MPAVNVVYDWRKAVLDDEDESQMCLARGASRAKSLGRQAASSET